MLPMYMVVNIIWIQDLDKKGIQQWNTHLNGRITEDYRKIKGVFGP